MSCFSHTVNGTVKKYSFEYPTSCSDISPRSEDTDFYAAVILNNIPEVPANGWTDYYYIGNNETVCSDPLSKPSGVVNIPLGVCLRDPAGWMNAVAYYGLSKFYSSKSKTADKNKYKKTGGSQNDVSVADGSKTKPGSKASNISKRQLQEDGTAATTGQPNVIEIPGNGKGYKTDVLNFRYLPQIGKPQCGVRIQYFEPTDKNCLKVLKKEIKDVEHNQCMEVLGSTATSEIYTFGTGDYIKSVASYDGITDKCLASFNDGYTPDGPVVMLRYDHRNTFI